MVYNIILEYDGKCSYSVSNDVVWSQLPVSLNITLLVNAGQG